ncbi:MAG: hypothetical protein RLZ98_120 [Pseudomonadota bacterium]|jgi:carbon-monoxide dehydrogenase large subunit/6-hydroxypseudooxynicotine dehydrogenase subunit gamma
MADVAKTSGRVIGEPVARLEDPPLVRGTGLFAADVSFPHQLHMRIVRSHIANGRIVSIDTAEAASLPGVWAVWTGKDIAEIPPIPFRATKVQGLEPYCQPILAQGRVRYIGEPIAAVFAEDPYIAEDAADLVAADIEELPPVLSATAEPVEFLPGHTSEPTVVEKDYGDIEDAFRQAYAIVALDLSVGRHSGVPLETRGAIARYDSVRGVLELHGTAKKQHWNRDEIAKMLGQSPSQFHLFEGHVGGGFGVKGELYPEDVLVCLAALRLERPVKWVEDRRENLVAMNHSREQTHKIRAAIDADGRILGIDSRFWHDQGGYIRTHGVRVADLSAGMMLGGYKVPAYRVAGHFRITNKTPAATYRAPGRYETTFVRERLLDAIAAKVGIDAVDVRRRNFIAKAEMPYARELDALGTDVVLDSGDYALLLDKALARFGWEEARLAAEERRREGALVGLGLAHFVEKSGLGPSDGVILKVDNSGAVELVTGAASVGQGVETALAQIAAETLGVDYRTIRVIHGRTDQITYGSGAHASRVTVMSGSATKIAAEAVRAKALAAAAQMLQVPAAELDMVAGRVVKRGEPAGPSMALADVARTFDPNSPTYLGGQPGLAAEGWFHSTHMVYPYGIHIAQVRIDPDTGKITCERYLVAYDVGRAVNPKLVEGQIVGGFAQGLGGALLEEFRYDERGEPLSTTFADYMMPTAAEVPQVEVLVTEDAPSPLNPLGVKGAGEAGTNAAGAAIAAAIDDALGMPGTVTRLPVRPKDVRTWLARRPS